MERSSLRALLPLVLCCVTFSAMDARGYVDCCGVQAGIMMSDLAVVGCLAGVQRDTVGQTIQGRAELRVERVLFGSAAEGDTLAFVWDYPYFTNAIVSPRPPDPGGRQWQRTLWLLTDSGDGTVSVHSLFCSMWGLPMRGTTLLLDLLNRPPVYPRTFDLDPEEHTWKVEAVLRYVEEVSSNLQPSPQE